MYAVAVHESAHCLANYLANTHATHVSIVPRGEDAGHVLSGGASYEDTIRVPQRLYLTQDERCALLFLRLGDPSANWKTLRTRMRTARQGANDFVRKHHFVIGSLTDRLLKSRQLGAEDIRATIEAALTARG
jgi:hypothetical protein